MKNYRYVLMIFFVLVICLFFIRLVLPSQIDDISPGISCEDKLLKWADVYYVVPKFNNISMTADNVWCEEILGMDKELALHGVYHSYNEFGVDRSEEYLDESIAIFEECFGFVPERFKPPQLAINDGNKRLVREKMEIDLIWNQIFHKVYHCGDTGMFPNWFIRVF